MHRAWLSLPAILPAMVLLLLPHDKEDGVLDVPSGQRMTLGEPPAQDEGEGEIGTLSDSLPFEPNGEQLLSIAYRTWVYTDVGRDRTRLGYLRVGALMDRRGPEIKNEGCEGGWFRINPRGFVCVGKGATLDLNHPLSFLSQYRPRLGEGFPYVYGTPRKPAPHRYFRLVDSEVQKTVEGEEVASRALEWKRRAAEGGLSERLGVSPEPPAFLAQTAALDKPYGTKSPLRTLYHSGQLGSESGVAFVHFFESAGRAFGLTTELDLLPLDRVELREGSPLSGVLIPKGSALRIAFVVKDLATLWRKTDAGRFDPVQEVREKRGFVLTGREEPGGFLETVEGSYLAGSSLRRVEPRDSFPSFATGTRKWIDVSIVDQVLVAYEGRTPVFATLVSTGRGEMGNPELHQATVRGTFMIYEKSVSSTMDGDEDRADSYELSDVPFVQYFHKGFALHGAYWHNEFGRARSHGCINLSAQDSAWLFAWTDPEVPPGWHAVLNKERGTVLHIHR